MSSIQTHSLSADYRGQSQDLPPPFEANATQRLLEIFSQKHPFLDKTPCVEELWSNTPLSPIKGAKISRIQMIREPYSQGAESRTFLCLKTTRKLGIGYKLYLLKAPIKDRPLLPIRFEIEKSCSDHLITLKIKELEKGHILQKFANQSDLEDLVFNSIKKNLRLTHDQLLSISKQLLTKVEMLHQLHIAHLDLKPLNILINENKLRDLSTELEVFITDFGLSNRFSSTKIKVGLNPTGTYCFFPPEFVYRTEEERRLERWVNPFQADLFSLGLTLFFLSSGNYLPYCIEPHLPRKTKQDFKTLVDLYHQKIQLAFSSMDSTKLLECEQLHKNLIKNYVPPIPGLRNIIFELLRVLPVNRLTAGACLKHLMEAKKP